MRAHHLLPGLALVAVAAAPASAIADGTPLTVVTRQSVFGSAVGVGNTLMEHDGRVNFAVRVEGSQAEIPLSLVPADATVVQAFLFWGGTFAPFDGVPLDRDVDLVLPDGTLLNDLSVDGLRPGEPAPPTTNRCVQRDHPVGGDVVSMFSCRREITALAQALGPGGVVGTWEVSDVDLSPGDCAVDPGTCEAKFGGWAVVVLWQSPTEPVKRDLVLADAFFALDEQGSQFGGFSSGLSPDFTIGGLNVNDDESGEITILAWEGDAQLGVPPQNLLGNPFRCNDGRCEDFIDVRGGSSPTRVRLRDATSRAGNLMNGSNNKSGGSHPGLDIDTFDIGRTGLGVLRAGDTSVTLRAGSGDGVADDGSGGSGELFLLGFTLVSVETFAPRFLNAGTEKVVLEPVAGPGEILNYILRIENDGSANATNTIVKDQLPASVTYVTGSTTNTCGVPSGDVGGTSPVLTAAGLNVGTLTVGERCEVRFRVVVRDTVNEGDVIQNLFTVQADGVPALQVGPAITTVEDARIAQPTKSVSVQGGGEPAPGSVLVYRIRVDNVGSRPAPDVRIVDELPATLDQVTVVSVPAGSSDASTGNTVDVRDIDIAAGSFAEVVVTGRIVLGTPTGTAIVNQAEVDQPSLAAPLLTDDPAVNDTPTDPTIVRVTAGIDLSSSTKTATDLNGGRLVPGDVVEFRVRVDKRGPAPTVVTLDDDLPAHVSACAVQAPIPPGAVLTCQPGGANGTGRLSGLVAFAGPGVATFVFRVTVDGDAPDGASITNTARLTPLADASLAVDVSSAPLVVFARPDLRIDKAVVDVTGAPARPDDLLQFTMTLTNQGTVAATNVVVTDVVDANLVIDAVQDGGVAAGQTLTWTLPTLAVGATAQVRFSARIRPGTLDGTTLTNRARGDADDPQAPVDSNTVSVVVRASPTLTVTKTVTDTDGAPFRPTDTVRYTLIITNSGDGIARDVVVTDPLDASFANVILGSGGRLVGNNVVFDESTVPALDTLASGGTVTLTFDARLDPVLPNGTIVSNQAAVTTPSLPAVTTPSDDPNTAAPLDPTRFTVTSQAVLVLQKTFVDDNGGALLPGETVTFTLTVTNTGDAPATAVLVEDPLDARLAFVSSADGGTFAGGRVRFPTFTLNPAPARTLRFVARVTTPLPDGTTIDNQAQASSPTALTVLSDDPTTATPLDPTRLVITSRPVLDTSTKTVTDLDGDGFFRPRDRIRYTIVVENTGSEDANGVQVRDPVPANLTNVTPGPGGTVAGGEVRFTLGRVAVGERRVVTFDADIVRPLADDTVIGNQAVVRAGGIADVLTDDPATAALDDPTSFTVTSDPFLVVRKTVVDDNGPPAEPGDTLTWTITLENTGDRDTATTGGAVTVTDVVDPALEDVVPQDGGVLAGDVITWTIPNVGVDTTTTVRFRSRIQSPLANATVVANQARASFVQPDVPGAPFLSDDPATAAPLDPTRVQVVSAADLSTSTLETFDTAGAAIVSARPGDTVEYRLRVTNTGRAVAEAVVVTVPFPAGFVVVDPAGGTVSGTTVTLALGTIAPGAGNAVERRLRLRLPTPLDDDTAFDVQGRIDGAGFAAAFFTDDPSTAAPADPTRLVIDSAPVLSLTKTILDDDGASDGGAFEPGDVVTVRLGLTNTGDAIARDVVLEDPLPAALTHVAGGRLVGSSVFFDRATTAALAAVAPGAAAVVVTFQARIGAATPSGTVVSNQARAVIPGVPETLSDDPATAAPADPTRITVTAVPRLTLTKDARAGATSTRTFAPGDVVTYAITLTSTGTAPAQGAFTDVVDAAFADVVPGPDLTFDPGTRTLSGALAPLAPGATRTLTFSATLRADLGNGTVVDNQARVTDAALGTVASDDAATAIPADPTRIVVDATPVLATSTKVAVDEDGGPLLPGDRLRYTIVVENTGNGAARDVVVTDVVDSDLVTVVDAPGGTVTGDTVVFDGASTPALAALPRGGRVTLSFVVVVNDAVADGTPIANQATIASRDVAGAVLTDDPATAAADDPTVVVVQAPRLVVQKSAPPGDLAPGQPLQYDLVVQNQGSVDAHDVVLRDVLPAALRDAALAGGAVTDGIATLTLPLLGPGESHAVALTAVVDPLAVGGTVVSNQAEVTAREVGLAVLSDDPDTAAPDDPTVRVVVADERFVGTLLLFDGETGAPIADGDIVEPRQRVRARVFVQNTGTQTARAVVVEVPFSRLRFVPDETTEGGIIDSSGDDVRVRWTASQLPALTALAPGERVVVELEGAVARPIPDGVTLPFAGAVTSIATTTPETIGPVTVRVRSRPDLSASTKEVEDLDGGLVEPGDVLSWRITVLNDGGTEARDVVLVDPIPAGMRLVAGTLTIGGSPVDGDPGGGVPLGDVGVGRAVIVSFQTRVELSAPRGVTLANQALLLARDANEARTDDPRTPLVLGDPTAVVIGGGSLLVAQKTAAPSPARTGAPLTFAIAIENAGTEAATDVLVEDPLPAGATYQAGTLTLDGAPLSDARDGDAGEIADGTLRVRLPRVEAGDGVLLTFRVVPDPGTTRVSNQATVTTPEGLTVLTDGNVHAAGAQPTVVPVDTGAPAPLQFDDDTLELIDENGGVVVPGDALLLRFALRNGGLRAGVVQTLDVRLPDGTTVDGALDPRLTTSAGVLALATTLPVAPREAAEFVVRLRVDDDVGSGTVLTATGTAAVVDAATPPLDPDGDDVDLGEAKLTVGLLPGTAALSGSLFVDGGARDGVLAPATDEDSDDVRVAGFTVQAFWRDDDAPAQTAITDAQGRFRLAPLPAGATRLVVISSGGARFAEIDLGRLGDGEVRAHDIAIEPMGSVYVVGDGGSAVRAARGARVALFVDDGNRDPSDDVLVDAALLPPGQQLQSVGAQGFYRFDPPPGVYRLGVVVSDPLLTFPSGSVPVQPDARHPLGRQASAGDIGDVTLPTGEDEPPPWVARFRVDDSGQLIRRNHLPLDPLSRQVSITKTATKKRASVGDIVTWEVRIDNKAVVPFLAGEDRGVEIADTLPSGFVLVDGSFQLARLEVDARGQTKRRVEPVTAKGDRTVRFGPFDLRPQTSYVLRYNTVVGPGTRTGSHENTAALRLADGAIPVTDIAAARVVVTADDTFDLGSVRAKVFCDADGDGWQDEDERGAWGARVYLDNGAWADADVSGKLHFSGVEPGMHTAKLDERSLLGMTTTSARQSFYLSAGLPAQIAFPVQCRDETVGPVDVEVNADAYRPRGVPEGRKVTVRGSTRPARVTVADTALVLPEVSLALAERGAADARATGPNLAAADAGLLLRPRVKAAGDVVAWQIAIEDLGPAPAAPPPRAAVGATAFEDALVDGGTSAEPSPGPPAAPSLPSSGTAVYLLAGTGEPPPQVAWNGRDADSGRAVLVDGHVYRAVLTVGIAGGDRASGVPAFFGVAVGASEQVGETRVLGAIDESDGPLFTTAGRPTTRLLGFVGSLAQAVRELPDGAVVQVRAHLDSQPGKPVAQMTADRADVVVKALMQTGVPALRLRAVGLGDEQPLFPNTREKDRKKNRRVELVVPLVRREVPPLPILGSAPVPPVVILRDTAVPVAADGSFAGDVIVAPGAALRIELVTSDGARVRLVRDPAAPQPSVPSTSAGLAPVPVQVDAAAHRLVVDGAVSPALALLGVRVAAELDDGAARVSIPDGIAVRRTTLRVLIDKDGAPAFSEDDATLGTPWKDIVVDGRASRIPLGATPPKGARLRLRVVVEDEEGNTGISPDVVVGGAVAAAPPPTGTVVLVPDPFDDDGALRPAALAQVQEIARAVSPGASVRVEVHSDDRGSRLARLSTTQARAEALKGVLVAAGVAESDVIALGRGSDAPLVPNTGRKARAKNRRAEITIHGPPSTPGADALAAPSAPTTVTANGVALSLTQGAFDGRIAPLDNGEIALVVHDADHARAFVRVRPHHEVWQGTPAAYAAAFPVPVLAEDGLATAVVPGADGGGVVDAGPSEDAALGEKAPHGEGEVPPWWPELARVPASRLQVTWPAMGAVLTHDLLPVRGRAPAESRVLVNGREVPVDPVEGTFATQVKLAEGAGTVVVEAIDALGNKARVKRDVRVDTSGWFALLLADTAAGGDGALLDERAPTTSLTLGDAFVYGRGAAYVKGRFRGPWLFADYDLTLHVDTRRFDDGSGAFFRDALDPDRFQPAWGDSSFEVAEARSGLPLYLDVTADDSRLTVGNVRTEIVGGDLLRYQRARTGLQLRFDRGWLDPVDVTRRAPGERASPAADPWRTQTTGFVTGGGGERHARVELMGTGGSVYFLRHERIVEGSERVAILVRDGVTGAEIARTPLARNVDYTIRTDEGRILLKQPLSAFADASFITNHNLGQVASGHRVFLEVDYEHQDDRRLQGLASGVDVAQTLGGHVEVGGSYVVEGREDGGLAYQVGGVRAKLFLDEGTFLKAELLGSQSVDAGNFVSFDGGLSYSALGQSLDQKDVRLGDAVFPAERRGVGFKLDGQARFGQYFFRSADDAIARAYFQAQQPGFFGGGGSIVEQGQTKWGGEIGWRPTTADEFRLRYDGVLAEIPERPPVTLLRTLNRQLATGRYARRLVPGLSVAGEIGYGYTGDSGRFGGDVGDDTSAREVQTVITAAGVDWAVTEALTMSVKQEVIVLGDERQLRGWNDHFVTHVVGRYALTDVVDLDAGASVRWSGENQVHAGVGLALDDRSRVYASERVGLLPAPGADPAISTMGFSQTTVVGAETQLGGGSKAYGEYQLQSAFGAEQARGVVGLASQWVLPFGFALSLGYERITTLGGTVPLTENGNVPPAAFTDGIFYAAPGANGGGSFLYGEGSRDAASAGVEWKRDDLLLASTRFELRYDNFLEERGGHDTLWMLSMTSAALKMSPELSLLVRYNLGLAHDLALGARAAYLEEASVGVAFRPITHDWFSALSKLSRRVDVRPVSLVGGVDDTTVHAASFEPIVQLPWHLQIVEKLAVKHARVAFDDVPTADAVTLLWINRVNLHTLSLLRSAGVDPLLPGEVDVGVEYRVLTGLTYQGIEHGALVELQVAPVDVLRIGVGWNFTRFSDDELDAAPAGSGTVDRSGFFVRVVGTY